MQAESHLQAGQAGPGREQAAACSGAQATLALMLDAAIGAKSYAVPGGLPGRGFGRDVGQGQDEGPGWGGDPVGANVVLREPLLSE